MHVCVIYVHAWQTDLGIMCLSGTPVVSWRQRYVLGCHWIWCTKYSIETSPVSPNTASKCSIKSNDIPAFDLYFECAVDPTVNTRIDYADANIMTLLNDCKCDSQYQIALKLELKDFTYVFRTVHFRYLSHPWIILFWYHFWGTFHNGMYVLHIMFRQSSHSVPCDRHLHAS